MIKILLTIFTCLTLTTNGQTHFIKTKAIENEKIPISHGTDVVDTTYVSYIRTKKILSLKEFQIEVRELKGTDSSVITILKKNKLFQKFRFAIPYSAFHTDDTAFVADINGDRRLDIKFFIFNNGAGLAGSLSTKLYLFNMKNKFKLVSFFDFAYEKEYDLNSDGKYEIISCNHVYKGNHSYWVYNTYNFENGSLINNSKKFNYPLWTRFLEKTNRVVANNITSKYRMKEFKPKPDRLHVE